MATAQKRTRPAAAKTRASREHAAPAHHGFWYAVRMGLNYLSVGIYYAIKYVALALFWTGKGVYLLIKRLVDAYRARKEGGGYGKLKSDEAPAAFQLVETIQGNYKSVWSKLRQSDSLIGIVLGARGAGKSAVALAIAENVRGAKKHMASMGFGNAKLPQWIKEVKSVSEIENDSFVLIDEGGILFSSRESGSAGNKLLSELLLIARHKSLSILFISQNSSNLEINTLRQADLLILKKSSLLQKEFERKIVAEIYEKYQEGFERHKRIKGLSLFYADQFIGFVENSLPSFWTQGISKGHK